MTPLQERFKEAIIGQYATNPNNINELSLACEKIADEFACDFGEWLEKEAYTMMTDGFWWCIKEPYPTSKITTSQVLQQFKEERK